MSTVSASVTGLGGDLGTLTGTVSTQATAIANIETGVVSQWEVKASAGGVEGKIGLYNDNGDTKVLIVASDLRIELDNGTRQDLFTVNGGGAVFNVPVDVTSINGLDATFLTTTIGNATIGYAWITGAHIEDLSVGTLQITDGSLVKESNVNIFGANQGIFEIDEGPGGEVWSTSQYLFTATSGPSVVAPDDATSVKYEIVVTFDQEVRFFVAEASDRENGDYCEAELVLERRFSDPSSGFNGPWAPFYSQITSKWEAFNEGGNSEQNLDKRDSRISAIWRFETSSFSPNFTIRGYVRSRYKDGDVHYRQNTISNVNAFLRASFK